MAIYNMNNKWISYYITNPLKSWWKARKYFKRPKISFRIYRVRKYSGYPYASYNWIAKILDIHIHDVSWKDKYDSPRHERNPIVWICLFRFIAFTIHFNIYYYNEFGEKQGGDMYYWEYLLEWLYYRQSLTCYSTWIGKSGIYKTIDEYGKANDGSEDTYKPCQYVVPTVAMSLNKTGIKKLKEELNEQRRNSKNN